MLNNKLIPLTDLDDKTEIWRGTRFRQYNVGLNVSDKSQDYYEYMLVEIPGENEHMLLTCVEGYKSGIALAYVKTSNNEMKFVVEGKEIKRSLGIKDTYVIKETI